MVKEQSRITHVVVFVLLLVTTQTFCQYTIPSFNTGMRTIPPSGNDVIIPFEGTTLKQVTTVPELKPGEVLLRRRFSPTEYGLFIGKINESAYGKLSAFRVKGFSLNDAVMHKFYGKESINTDLDISNLYFDNDLVYVENAERLFYYENGWLNIKNEDNLPARLTITSEPSGADVYIDGTKKGNTPYEAGAVFSPSVVVQVKKDGYYVQEDFVSLEGKAPVTKTKNFTLSKKISYESSAAIDSVAYTAKNTESVEELNDRITDVNKRIEDVKKVIDEFERAYPPLPPKNEFEKTAAYQERAKKYQEQKASEREKIAAPCNKKIAPMTNVLEQLKAYKATIEDRTFQQYFPTDNVQLGEYNADSEYFPITVKVKEGNFDFSFQGKLLLSVVVAQDFKKKTADGKLSLSYKNKVIQVTQNREAVKRYYDFADLKLRFKDKDYALEGTFELPEYVTASSAWKEYKAAQDKIIQEKLAQEQAEQAKIAEKLRTTPTDADGNVYHIVTIGTQTWTVENLKTTHFNDGTEIPEVTDKTEWKNLTTPGYCWYKNDKEKNKDTYGALYNWYVVNTGKLAPKGWHVPTAAEWSTLSAYLGGAGGGALKDAGTTYWNLPNTVAVNSSGFSALSGGYRHSGGGFYGKGYFGLWWSVTAYLASYAWDRDLCGDISTLYRDDYYKSCGLSVRLVRDN